MPYADLPRSRLYYEDQGSGHPVLALAPGGLDSQVDFWARRKTGEPRPFRNPIPALAERFRVITLDQRNAGRSTGVVSDQDGWHTYAEDYIALMDHLGVDRFHLIGACIGGPLGFRLLELAPQRVSAFVVQATTGLHHGNRHLFDASFAGWQADLLRRQPEIPLAWLAAMNRRMYDGDFVFSVSRDFVRSSRVPLLVLAGGDHHHPLPISEEIVRLSPCAEFLREWQGEAHAEAYHGALLRFFIRHVPQ